MNSSLLFDQTLATIQVIGTADDFTRRVRATLVDDLVQPAVRFTSAKGGEPLRDLLRRAHGGEEVILASYALFTEASPFREYGPVYISAVEGQPAWTGDVFESDYFGSELILRAYNQQRWIGHAQRVSKREAPGVIQDWLSDNRTRFVDARFPTYGCFACRFSRFAGEKPADI